jgi:hypothetical protein
VKWRYNYIILNLGTRRSSASGTDHFPPGVGGSVGRRAGLEAVPAGNQTPVVQPVAIPTELSQLVKYSG